MEDKDSSRGFFNNFNYNHNSYDNYNKIIKDDNMELIHCPKCNNVIPQDAGDCPACIANLSPKSPVMLQLLCVFLGVLGAHRFYVGKWGTGLLMLATLGGFGFWVLIDLIFIASNKFDDKEGRVIVVSKSTSFLRKAFAVIGSIIIGIATMILVFVVVIMFFTAGLVSVVKEQLSALHSGDMEKAYSYTSKEYQATTSLDQFKAFVNNYPALTHNEKTSFTTRNISTSDGVSTGALSGTLFDTDGQTTSATYTFVKEGDAWKIQDLNIGLDQEQNGSDENTPLSLLFEEKNARYTINYPATWGYKASGKGTVKIADRQGDAIVYIDALLSKKNGGIYENNQAVNDDYIGQFKSLAPNFKIENSSKMNLSTNPNIHGDCFTATYTYQDDALKRMQCSFANEDGQIFYSWAFVTPQNQYDKRIGLAKKMLDSFAIQKSTH
jgi:hypothetical protein